MEKLQFYANMSYSALFVQENTSKDQEINQNAKPARLKRPQLA